MFRLSSKIKDSDLHAGLVVFSLIALPLKNESFIVKLNNEPRRSDYLSVAIRGVSWLPVAAAAADDDDERFRLRASTVFSCCRKR